MGFPSVGKSEDTVGIGTQTWNIADGFTKIKILRLLIQLDIDEEVAMFGKKDDVEQVNFEEIPYKRVEGLEKFIFHLKQLIGNSKFTIDFGKDNQILFQFMERIAQVEEVINGVATNQTNLITKEEELIINEYHFRICFNILKEIKDNLNSLLNRAGLIFRQGEELDLDAIMRSIEDGE